MEQREEETKEGKKKMPSSCFYIFPVRSPLQRFSGLIYNSENFF